MKTIYMKEPWEPDLGAIEPVKAPEQVIQLRWVHWCLESLPGRVVQKKQPQTLCGAAIENTIKSKVSLWHEFSTIQVYIDSFELSTSLTRQLFAIFKTVKLGNEETGSSWQLEEMFKCWMKFFLTIGSEL